MNVSFGSQVVLTAMNQDKKLTFNNSFGTLPQNYKQGIRNAVNILSKNGNPDTVNFFYDKGIEQIILCDNKKANLGLYLHPFGVKEVNLSDKDITNQIIGTYKEALNHPAKVLADLKRHFLK